MSTHKRKNSDAHVEKDDSPVCSGMRARVLLRHGACCLGKRVTDLHELARQHKSKKQHTLDGQDATENREISEWKAMKIGESSCMRVCESADRIGLANSKSCARVLRLRAVIDIKNRHHHVLTFDHNDNLKTVLQGLATRNVTAAPVISNIADSGSAGEAETDQYLGVISVQDILRSLFNRVLQQHEDARQEIPAASWEALIKDGHTLLESKAITALGQDIDLMTQSTITFDTPLSDMLQNHFMTGNNGTPVHRVGLFDGHARLRTIVSQSDVVRFFAAHGARLPEYLRDEHINELGLVRGVDSLISVPDTVTAATAFLRMFEANVSGLAVLGDEGHVIDSISASDLRGFSDSDLMLLSLPVQQFLTTRQPMRKPLVTIAPDARFHELLVVLASHRVHRVYVVDGADRPHGVISLTDVIRTLADSFSAA